MIVAVILLAALAAGIYFGWRAAKADNRIATLTARSDRDVAVCDEAENGWVR